MAARKTSRSGAKPASRSGAKPASASRKKTTVRKAAGKPAARKSTASKSTAKKAAAAKATGAKKAPSKKGASKKPGTKKSSAVDRVAEIQRVIDVMVEAGAVEVELEEAGSKLRVRLREEHPAPVVSYAAAPAALPAAAPAPAAAGAPAAGSAGSSDAAAPVDDANQHVMKSPMVGTFYRQPSPDADSFVQVGDAVTPDTTVCILEAMKVMNEIKSEVEGRVAKILVQSGEPVEFGQPLFVIEVS